MSVEIQQKWHCNKCDVVTRHDAMANKTWSDKEKVHRQRKCFHCGTIVKTVELRQDEYRELEYELINVTKLLSFRMEKKAKGILDDIAKALELCKGN